MPVTVVLRSTGRIKKAISSSLANPAAPMLGISASLRQAARNALAIAVQVLVRTDKCNDGT